MKPRLPVAADLVGQMNAFFGEAFERGNGMTPERLAAIFASHVHVTRDDVAALLDAAEAGLLSELAASLKASADAAHPSITKRMPAAEVLAYVLNTLADGFGIAVKARLPVELPPHMEDHGDSLFAAERKKFV